MDIQIRYITVIFSCIFRLYCTIVCCQFIYVITFIYYVLILSRCVYHTMCLKLLQRIIYGILGSALYTLSIYRLLCIYMRAAVGEFTAMTFIPLVLIGMYRIYNTEKANYKEWIFLAIGMAGLILSHIISTFIVLLFLLFVCIICMKRTLIPNKLVCIGKVALTAALPYAWFLVPFIDMSLSNQTMVMQRDYNLNDSSVYLFNLFNIFSSADSLKHITYKHNSLMGINIGLPLIIGMVVVIQYWYKAKQVKKSVILTFSLSMFAILLACNVFPWYIVQQYCGKFGEMISKIQFPWRFMGVAIILLTFAILFSLNELSNIDSVIHEKCAKYLVIGIVLSVGFFNYSFSASSSNRELYNRFNRSSLTISNGEYLLIDTDYESLKSAIPFVSQGTMVIESYKKEKGIAILSCGNVSEEYAKVEVPVLAYNHYCAMDMLTKKKFNISVGINNRLSIEIPPMYHGKIKIQFVSPWYWRISELLSLLTILVVILFSVSKKIRFDM